MSGRDASLSTLTLTVLYLIIICMMVQQHTIPEISFFKLGKNNKHF